MGHVIVEKHKQHGTKERGREGVCFWEREREGVCVCWWDREREWERISQ